MENEPGGDLGLPLARFSYHPGINIIEVRKNHSLTRTTVYFFSILSCSAAISCTFQSHALCHAKTDTIQPPNQDNFKYGQNVTFECATGFVYGLDPKKKKATMQCLSLPGTPYQGAWYPDPCQACNGT